MDEVVEEYLSKEGAMARPLRIEYPGALYHVMGKKKVAGTII